MWPYERYAELADILIDKYNARIILVGGEQDRPVCQKVMQAMKYKALDLSGRTTVRDLIAGLAELDLVVSNVTGPMHIAAALPKPKVIGLYGVADTVQYAPWSDRAVMVTKGRPEDAYWRRVNYEEDHKRLLEITVSDVLDTIMTVMH